MIRKIFVTLALLAFGAGSAQAISPVTNFGSNPGKLNMYVHLPKDGAANPAPLVLALHGCTQSASTYHNESGWSQLGDKHGFYVVYPEQGAENKTAKTGNPYKCFNWAGYYGERMKKGDGENASIMQMIEYMKRSYAIDASRIYITGLSAGGGMASMMLALYPDVFAGGAPMAGLPYHCASNVDDAYGCMGVTSAMQPRTGPGCESGEACMDPRLKRSAEQWGNLARSSNGNHAGAYPRVLIWQGDKDQYVDDDNAIEVMKQFTNLHGTDQTADVAGASFNGSAKHAYREYHHNGKAVVGVVDLFGMKHGIAVDPGTGEDQGGKPALAMGYTHDWDVFSSYYTAQWWGLLGAPGNQGPVVTITAPADGAHLTGSVEVTATAEDADGIAYVDFYLNGQLLARDISAPYSTVINAASLADGTHELMAVARDAHPEDARDGEQTIRVTTGNDMPQLRFTSPADGAHVSGTVNFTVGATDRDGIAYVDFYLNDQPAVRVSAAPFTISVDTSALADGSHTLRAVAVDASADAKQNEARIGFETGFECQDWTTYNMYHVMLGRARNVSLLWWAPDYRTVGSDEKLGSSSFLVTTVRTSAKQGHYELGACPGK